MVFQPTGSRKVELNTTTSQKGEKCEWVQEIHQENLSLSARTRENEVFHS